MSEVRLTDRVSFRKRLGKFFKKLTVTRTPTTRPRPTPARDDQFHYVISSVQEDEIRESFLVEKLRCYTQSLSESDFESIAQDLDESEGSLDNEDAEEKLSIQDDDSQCENGFIFVTWSSNKECTHVFHESCIIDWLNSSGRRHLRRRRRQDQQEGLLNYANDPLRKITRFPMPCPCCRQVFICCSEAMDDNAVEQQASIQPAPLQASTMSTTHTVADEDQGESEPAENNTVAVESIGYMDTHFNISCVELSPSDEATGDEDRCDIISSPMSHPLAIQIEA